MKSSTYNIPANLEDWHQRSNTALKGQALEKVARKPQKGGLNWKVLYTAEDAQAKVKADLRKTQPIVTDALLANGPELIQKYQIASGAEPQKISQLLLQDLEGGVSGVSFTFQELSTQVQPMAPTLFVPGFWKQALAGVEAELVSFEVPLPFNHSSRQSHSNSLQNLLSVPAKMPKSIAAKFDISKDLRTQFDVFEEFATNFPRLEVLFEACTLHDRGANSLLELASFLAFEAEFKRRFKSLSPSLSGRFKVRLSVNSNLLGSIAKIRAARVLWAQQAADAAPLQIYAETSAAESSRYDTWTNIVRASSQCAAALMANCNGVTVLPHDLRAVAQNPFSHRIARNVFNILVNECHLAKISDPLQGSFAIESHTFEIVEAAKKLYEEIEALGGLVAVWHSGWLASQLQVSRKKLIAEESCRRPGTIGVSEFPNANEWLDLLNHECADLFPKKDNKVFLPENYQKSFNTIEAAANWQEPLFVSDMFSSLREVVSLNWRAATGCSSLCFTLIVLGNASELSARISWVENIFGTLGLSRQESVHPIAESSDWQEKLRRGLPERPMPLQIIVASDQFYETNLPELVKIVEDSNIKNPEGELHKKTRHQILVAGRIQQELFDKASPCGLNGALYAGANVYEVLQTSLKSIGVDQ